MKKNITVFPLIAACLLSVPVFSQASPCDDSKINISNQSSQQLKYHMVISEGKVVTGLVERTLAPNSQATITVESAKGSKGNIMGTIRTIVPNTPTAGNSLVDFKFDAGSLRTACRTHSTSNKVAKDFNQNVVNIDTTLSATSEPTRNAKISVIFQGGEKPSSKLAL